MTNVQSAVDRLCALFDYPDGSFAAALAACRTEAPRLPGRAAAELERFAEAVKALSPAQLQELYVATFDLTPDCTLDLGWHLYAEAYERGAFLAMLRQELGAAGIPERGELPDHLPSVLRLIDRGAASGPSDLIAAVRSAITKLESALEDRRSPYAHLVKSAAAAAGAD